MIKKRKIKSVLLLALLLSVLLAGCGKSFEDYLAECKYEDAYAAASTDMEKTLAKAENTFAYLCQRIPADAFGGEAVRFTLRSARYIDGGKDLAEFFDGSHYYLLEIELRDETLQTAYILYFYDTENHEFRNIFNALSLEEDASDDVTAGFWKGAVDLIIRDDRGSYILDSHSLLRMNELLTNDLLPADITVSADMLLQN